MEKYEVNENKILEQLSEVTAAKRVASMVSFCYFFFFEKAYNNVSVATA